MTVFVNLQQMTDVWTKDRRCMNILVKVGVKFIQLFKNHTNWVILYSSSGEQCNLGATCLG